jgi:hypothetical protein
MLPTLVPALSLTAIVLLFLLLALPPVSFVLYDSRYRVVFDTLFLLTLVGILSGSALFLVGYLWRVEFTAHFLRFTFPLASLTTLAMFVISGLLIYETQVIYRHVNATAMSMRSVPFLLVIVICIAASTFVSCIFSWRGFAAMRELAMYPSTRD